MKKTLPREDFDLSSIDKNFIFTTKVGVLHSYFELPFYKRWNYDFAELPILNFLNKKYLNSIQNEKDIEIHYLIQNIKNNFIKHKMYKNIAYNFEKFNVNQLYKIFLKAPEEELVYLIKKLKEKKSSEDFKLLLKGLIFHTIKMKSSKCEEVLKELPNLHMNKNELNDFIHLCENKDMLYIYEYFKDNNQEMYHKMFERYTQKNISNF